MCYSFAKWDKEDLYIPREKALEYCQRNHSATLATIQSDEEEAFIMRHVTGSGWLYMTMAAPGVPPKTWDNNEPVKSGIRKWPRKISSLFS